MIETQMPVKTTHIRFSPDGKALAAGMAGGHVRFLTSDTLQSMAQVLTRNRLLVVVVVVVVLVLGVVVEIQLLHIALSFMHSCTTSSSTCGHSLWQVDLRRRKASGVVSSIAFKAGPQGRGEVCCAAMMSLRNDPNFERGLLRRGCMESFTRA